jgi:CMP/dCMP kinase
LNPIGTLLPADIQIQVPSANLDVLLGKTFFPNLIAGPFLVGLRMVFYVAAAMCGLGAVASLLRGQRFVAGALPHPKAAQLPPAVGKVRVVTISRQYGSGGGEVAVRLAHRLGWQVLDHAVVEEVAESLNLTQPEAEERDERAQSFVVSLIAGARLMGNVGLQGDDHPVSGLADLDIYARTVRGVIESAASIGNVVIIGRAAQFVLANRPDALHVRIIAPLEQRIAYVAHREQLDHAAARARILTKDSDREHYAQDVFAGDWNDEMLYDLAINTGGLDLDSVVDEIWLALERRNQYEARSGDGNKPAGLAPYSFEPRDFRPLRPTA